MVQRPFRLFLSCFAAYSAKSFELRRLMIWFMLLSSVFREKFRISRDEDGLSCYAAYSAESFEFRGKENGFLAAVQRISWEVCISHRKEIGLGCFAASNVESLQFHFFRSAKRHCGLLIVYRQCISQEVCNPAIFLKDIPSVGSPWFRGDFRRNLLGQV